MTLWAAPTVVKIAHLEKLHQRGQRTSLAIAATAIQMLAIVAQRT
jgi:hypothetical protein